MSTTTFQSALQRAARGESAVFSVMTKKGSEVRFQILRLADHRQREVGTREGVLGLWHPRSSHGPWGYVFIDGEKRPYIASEDQLEENLRDQIRSLSSESQGRVRCSVRVRFRAIEEEGGRWCATNVCALEDGRADNNFNGARDLLA